MRIAGRLLTRILRCHGRTALTTFILMILCGLVSGVGTLMLIPVLQTLGLHDGTGRGESTFLTDALLSTGLPLNLHSMLAGFVTLSIISAQLTRWLSLQTVRLKEDAVHLLRTETHEAVHRASWVFLVRRSAPDFIHSLTDSMKRTGAGILQMTRLLSRLCVALIQVAAAFMIAPWLTLLTLSGAGLLWPLLQRMNRRVADIGSELTDLNRSFLAEMSSQFAGVRETRALGAEQVCADTFAAQSDELRKAHLRFNAALAGTGMIYAAGSALLLSGLLLAARQFLQTPVPTLIVLVVVFARVFPSLRDIHRGTLHVLHMLPAFEHTMRLLEDCRNHAEEPDDAGGRDGDIHAEGSSDSIADFRVIRLRDVHFSYDNETTVLNGVHLDLHCGQLTAVTGPSGAGKSTLVDLLLTLLSPGRGEVLLDGTPLEHSAYRSWRRLVGYVPQQTYLFEGTVRSNLILASPQATDDELRKALEDASAYEFVRALPDGLETPVGERGCRLSGGERQRLALARALLRGPQLLILDEATSSLDGENREHIQKALKRLRDARPDLTIVTIGHELSAIRDADQVVVLEAGRVVETGTPAALLADSGSRFSHLFSERTAVAA